jgi:hypothetical protein
LNEASDANAKADASSVAPTFSPREFNEGDEGIFCFLPRGGKPVDSSLCFLFCLFAGTIIISFFAKCNRRQVNGGNMEFLSNSCSIWKQTSRKIFGLYILSPQLMDDDVRIF